MAEHSADVSTDITERKRMEAELRKSEEQLAQVTRLSTMGEMAAGLAHELNQPPTAITNYAKGTLRRLRSGEIGHGSPPSVSNHLTTDNQIP